MSTVETPWSDEVVERLQRYQSSGRFHPYTCSQRSLPGHRSHGTGEDIGVLVPGRHGFVCPDCGYVQTWCFSETLDIIGDNAASAVPRHNHVTRDIKPLGMCPGCDDTRKALGWSSGSYSGNSGG